MTLNDFERLEQGLPFKGDLRRLATKILDDPIDVEDVLQEVHVNAWLHARDGKPIAHMRNFLMNCTRNKAIDYVRKQRRERRKMKALRRER